MNDRIPAEGKAGRVLITPENGSAPFYATVTMADEPLEEGTPLNKATLLKDTTAVLLGGGEGGDAPEEIAAQRTGDLAGDGGGHAVGHAVAQPGQECAEDHAQAHHPNAGFVAYRGIFVQDDGQHAGQE